MVVVLLGVGRASVADDDAALVWAQVEGWPGRGCKAGHLAGLVGSVGKVHGRLSPLLPGCGLATGNVAPRHVP